MRLSLRLSGSGLLLVVPLSLHRLQLISQSSHLLLEYLLLLLLLRLMLLLLLLLVVRLSGRSRSPEHI